MRELTFTEVQGISGGFITPWDLALTIGLLGSGISSAGLTYSLAASGSGAQALGGGILFACLVGGAVGSLGAGLFLTSMIVTGYLSSVYKDEPFTGHVCV